MENFIRANLRFITWEIAVQKALRTVLPVRRQSTLLHVFETKGYTSNEASTVYTIQIYT